MPSLLFNLVGFEDYATMTSMPGVGRDWNENDIFRYSSETSTFVATVRTPIYNDERVITGYDTDWHTVTNGPDILRVTGDWFHRDMLANEIAVHMGRVQGRATLKTETDNGEDFVRTTWGAITNTNLNLMTSMVWDASLKCQKSYVLVSSDMSENIYMLPKVKPIAYISGRSREYTSMYLTRVARSREFLHPLIVMRHGLRVTRKDSYNLHVPWMWYPALNADAERMVQELVRALNIDHTIDTEIWWRNHTGHELRDALGNAFVPQFLWMQREGIDLVENGPAYRMSRFRPRCPEEEMEILTRFKDFWRAFENVTADDLDNEGFADVIRERLMSMKYFIDMKLKPIEGDGYMKGFAKLMYNICKVAVILPVNLLMSAVIAIARTFMKIPFSKRGWWLVTARAIKWAQAVKRNFLNSRWLTQVGRSTCDWFVAQSNQLGHDLHHNRLMFGLKCGVVGVVAMIPTAMIALALLLGTMALINALEGTLILWLTKPLREFYGMDWEADF